MRDAVIFGFSGMYREQGAEFPPGVAETDYRNRMKQCYPIHPELFDRLFDDWSALDKFQRTRGLLRLMALAISEPWKRNDQSLLIMPCNLPMDFGPLVSEMKKYLEDGWDPVIKSDVDGPTSPTVEHRHQHQTLRAAVRDTSSSAHGVHGIGAAARRQTGSRPEIGGAGLRAAR